MPARERPVHVYGPVPSRRLGRSLGVDLVPFKVCSYDCVYCQLGRTTRLTMQREEYEPLAEVMDDLSARLAQQPDADFIGIAGSGEPTLHAGIGDLIDAVKGMTDIPVAVLTNGSLLWMPEVRRALSHADVVMPSLDAGCAATFARVNRPVAGLSFEQMVEGLVAFTRDFRGTTLLEVFVLHGANDGPEEIGRIADLADRIGPRRVQLNTVARPPAQADAVRVRQDRLSALCGRFRTPCEVIAEEGPAARAVSGTDLDADPGILALLARRPCTVEGIATGLGMCPNDVIKHVEALTGRGLLVAERRDGEVFYRRPGEPPSGET